MIGTKKSRDICECGHEDAHHIGRKGDCAACNSCSIFRPYPVVALICGSRYDVHPKFIGDALDECHQTWNIVDVITGGAGGVDTFADGWADGMSLRRRIIPARWDIYGKSAGARRNIEMLDLNPDIVIAIMRFGGSRGTAHTIREAHRRLIPTRTYFDSQRTHTDLDDPFSSFESEQQT